MIRNVLESIQGVDVFPIIGLTLFLTVFIAYSVKALLTKKSDIDYYRNIPLD